MEASLLSLPLVKVIVFLAGKLREEAPDVAHEALLLEHVDRSRSLLSPVFYNKMSLDRQFLF